MCGTAEKVVCDRQPFRFYREGGGLSCLLYTSEAVRWVVKLFPVSHAGALLRQVMLEAPTAECFAGAPEAAVRDFQESMGVLYRYGDFTAGPFTHALVLLGVSILFFLPAWWNVSRKKS